MRSSTVEDTPDDAQPAAASPRPATRRKDPLGPGSKIGDRLRELYAQFEQEPIPADLIDLLEKLDDAERGRSGS